MKKTERQQIHARLCARSDTWRTFFSVLYAERKEGRITREKYAAFFAGASDFAAATKRKRPPYGVVDPVREPDDFIIEKLSELPWRAIIKARADDRLRTLIDFNVIEKIEDVDVATPDDVKLLKTMCDASFRFGVKRFSVNLQDFPVGLFPRKLDRDEDILEASNLFSSDLVALEYEGVMQLDQWPNYPRPKGYDYDYEYMQNLRRLSVKPPCFLRQYVEYGEDEGEGDDGSEAEPIIEMPASVGFPIRMDATEYIVKSKQGRPTWRITDTGLPDPDLIFERPSGADPTKFVRSTFDMFNGTEAQKMLNLWLFSGEYIVALDVLRRDPNLKNYKNENTFSLSRNLRQVETIMCDGRFRDDVAMHYADWPKSCKTLTLAGRDMIEMAKSPKYLPSHDNIVRLCIYDSDLDHDQSKFSTMLVEEIVRFTPNAKELFMEYSNTMYTPSSDEKRSTVENGANNFPTYIHLGPIPYLAMIRTPSYMGNRRFLQSFASYYASIAMNIPAFTPESPFRMDIKAPKFRPTKYTRQKLVAQLRESVLKTTKDLCLWDLDEVEAWVPDAIDTLARNRLDSICLVNSTSVLYVLSTLGQYAHPKNITVLTASYEKTSALTEMYAKRVVAAVYPPSLKELSEYPIDDINPNSTINGISVSVLMSLRGLDTQMAGTEDGDEYIF